MKGNLYLQKQLLTLMYGMPREAFISFVVSYIGKEIPLDEVSSFIDELNSHLNKLKIEVSSNE